MSMVTNAGNPYPAYFQATGDRLIDATTNGHYWKLDESFTIDIAVANGFSGEYWYEPAQMALWLATASAEISYYTNLKFNFSGFYSNPIVAASNGAEITLSADDSFLLFDSSSSWARGFFPDSSSNARYPGAPGDIYINFNSEANYLPSYELGSQGWFLLLHEMGHALGLKHPHDDGGTGRPTFNSVGFGNIDNDTMTMMSYDDSANWNYFSWDPATPMILDVYALQYLYGRNTDVNSGNDTFTLTDDNYYLTIWDPSGADVIDASQSTVGWTIYLPEESLSNLSDTRAGIAVPTRDWYSNVPQTLRWLAGDYENVIGSGYDDTIKGNLFANILQGGRGNDIIFGAGGNDFIDGGLGTDTAEYQDTSSSYGITSSTDGSTVEISSTAEGTDTLVNIEKIQFADGIFNVNELLRATPTVFAGNTLDVIVDLFGTVSMLKGLIEVDDGTVHTLSYNGTVFNYAEVDPLITTVVRNGEFTEEFAQEIADAYPSAAGIKYNTVVTLFGVAAIDDLLISVAGADGFYVA